MNSLLMQVFSLYPLEQPPTEAAAKSAHVAEVSSEQSALAWFSLVIVSPEHLVMVDMPFPSGLHFPNWSSGMSAHISPEQSALGDVHSLSDVDAPAAAGAVLGVLPEVAGPQSAQSVPRGQTWDAAPERPSSHSPSFENEHALEHAWPETIATCKSTSARIIIFRAFLDESCGGDHQVGDNFWAD